VSYWTNVDGPETLDCRSDILDSATTALKTLQAHDFDGFLVASFATHPLIDPLKERTRMLVVGILESSLFWATNAGTRFGILTTKKWDDLLKSPTYGNPLLSGEIRSIHFSIREVSRHWGEIAIENEVREATRHLVEVLHCDVLVIGCVELAAIFEHIVRQTVGKNVPVINAVTAGLNILARLVHGRQETSAVGGYGTSF
jgi:Asp/Glu/hydantoin racemase